MPEMTVEKTDEKNDDLENYSRPELFSECKRKGINTSRSDKKKMLIDKLNAYHFNTLSGDNDVVKRPEEEVEKAGNKVIADEKKVSDELEDLGINKDFFVKKEPTTDDGFTVSEVVDECNILFQGCAIAKYNEDNPTMIEFHGGARQRQDVTISQPRKAIVMYAKIFCSRASFSPSDIGSVEGKKLSGNETHGMNLDAMTPQQIEQLRKDLYDMKKT